MGHFRGSLHYSPNNGTPNFNNPLKKIKIKWYPNYSGQRRITCIGSSLGFFGNESGTKTKDITVYGQVPASFNLTASKTNLLCTEGVTISGAPSSGVNYYWNTSGGVIQNTWNGGIYISRFTNVGVVPITLTVGNDCFGYVTKTITLNVVQPDFGHVTQNGNNVDVPGSLVSLDCQGNFYLGMPWVSNNAIYTWELPGTSYDAQTNTYTKTIQSGVNKLNVQGQLPTGGLTDFVGKVTITGVCGAPVVRTFIIRPTLRPTVDADIYSCSNTVVINVNNPTANGNINAWVAPTYPSVWGTFANPTPTSVQFTAPNPGAYVINIQVYGVGGCNTLLQTTVHAGTASQNTNAGTAGWQSGVLSDNRKAVGSNIVNYAGNIYFAGRDGKIYFYSFSAALQKWVINEIPGITNVSVPATSTFNKIGIATLGTITYLFYTENTGLFKKVNLATNFVDDGVGTPLNAIDLITSGNDVYVIQKTSNLLYYNTSQTPYTLVNSSLKAIVPGNGVAYVQANNLFVTGIGQITTTADVYSSSDVIYYNGWLYYARGQKGSANLYRMQVGTPSSLQQITTSSNLSGIFNINPASGVIYYGIMNLGVANTISTQTSGSYKGSDVYQAHLSGTAWILNKATTVVNYEGLDMLIHSAVYSGNHLYYVGAGRNSATGGSTRELEVWNLYYENACAPVLQRVAADDMHEGTSLEVLVYPNPFNAELSIDLSAYAEDDNLTLVAIEVTDAAGKTIYKTTVLSELTLISTIDWPQGLYVVKISHNNTIINKKVVKY